MSNHLREKGTGCICRYYVYHNRSDDDSVVASFLTAKECAELMNITVKTFYTYLGRKNKKWHIVRYFIDEDYLE